MFSLSANPSISKFLAKLEMTMILIALFSPLASHAISITPTELEFVAKPGESKLVQVVVTNNSQADATYEVSVENFSASSDEGVPFHGAKVIDRDLASWADHIRGGFQVRPGATQKFGVVFKIPEDERSGGAYGTIFLKETIPSLEAGGPSIEKKVGALVFGTIGSVPSSPPTVEKINFTRTSFIDPPSEMTVELRNDADTHITPRGSIVFMNIFGRIYANFPINNRDLKILPGTSRNFHIVWRDAGYDADFGMANMKPGAYRAIVKLTTGNGPLEDMATEYFLVLPGKYLIGLFVAFGLLVFATIRSIRRTMTLAR